MRVSPDWHTDLRTSAEPQFFGKNKDKCHATHPADVTYFLKLKTTLQGQQF